MVREEAIALMVVVATQGDTVHCAVAAARTCVVAALAFVTELLALIADFRCRRAVDSTSAPARLDIGYSPAGQRARVVFAVTQDNVQSARLVAAGAVADRKLASEVGHEAP